MSLKSPVKEQNVILEAGRKWESRLRVYCDAGPISTYSRAAHASKD